MPKTVTREEVKALIEKGDSVLLEALPPEHYAQEHLPGALNLPHDRVDELAEALVPDKATPIVVYCSNGPCANSGIASRRLEQLGYQDVSDYELGKQDWVEAGLPTVTNGG
ncbi:MAG TPA: rhodanese-like domain-containing protein [Acidimicrobiales bacterium]|jgi:rhodanese-related sulfurtransferase